MSDPSKQVRIEELLRKSLLGEELVNTQFHLFSAKSSLSSHVVKPRVLCANNVLLAKSSTYFMDLLGSDINPSDSSLADLEGDHDVPSHAPVDEYGYGSDSDLDECHDPVPVTEPKPKVDRAGSKEDDDDESVSSDMFVMTPEQPREEESLQFALSKDGSVASSGTAVQAPVYNQLKELATKGQVANAMRLRSLSSRHVLVKDTAFQTWYTLLNYLYTDKFGFLPLRSTMPVGQPRVPSTDSLDEPRCSAKSMYRLASKVRLDRLRDEAFVYIRSSLTEHNILQELCCGLVSTHPDLLEMELDVLYEHIASSTVVAGFPAMARRIANKELVHGADIVMGIHTRLLKTSPSPSRIMPVPLTRTRVDPEQERAARSDESEDESAVASEEETNPVCERGSSAPAFGFASAFPSAKPGPAPLHNASTERSKAVCEPLPAGSAERAPVPTPTAANGVPFGFLLRKVEPTQLPSSSNQESKDADCDTPTRLGRRRGKK